MRAYVLRRFLQVVPLLLGITALTFLLLQLAPGDFLTSLAEDPQISQAALDALRHRYGLDQPWWVQYGRYLENLLHLDLGESLSRHQPVARVLQGALLNTLLLTGAAAIVTWGLAVPLGVWAAVRQHRFADRALSLFSFLWLSVPEIVSGLLLLMLAARTGWFPVGGMRSMNWDDLPAAGRALDLLHHLILPALVAGTVPLAARMRQMRSSMLDVLRLEYVTAARARGLGEARVVFRHALRNALNPMVTLFGFTIGSLLSGAFVAEVIFSWPGLGRVAMDAIRAHDPYLVMGSVLLASCMLILGNLAADLLLVAVDPRIARA